jgi:hypothetical protein
MKDEVSMNEKWPPLDPGTKVKTYKPNTDKRREWTDEGWARRRWGVTGVIITHHDSHGLYYDVRHGDGWIAGYDPSEFDVVLESDVKWENVVIRGDVLVNGEARHKILIDIQALRTACSW